MLLADRAVLRHVASSLAHEPDGSAVDGLRFAGADEAGIGGRHELLNLASFPVMRRARESQELNHRGHRETQGEKLGL